MLIGIGACAGSSLVLGAIFARRIIAAFDCNAIQFRDGSDFARINQRQRSPGMRKINPTKLAIADNCEQLGTDTHLSLE